MKSISIGGFELTDGTYPAQVTDVHLEPRWLVPIRTDQQLSAYLADLFRLHVGSFTLTVTSDAATEALAEDELLTRIASIPLFGDVYFETSEGTWWKLAAAKLTPPQQLEGVALTIQLGMEGRSLTQIPAIQSPAHFWENTTPHWDTVGTHWEAA